MDIREASIFDTNKINRHPWEIARIKIIKDILNPICLEISNVNIIDLGCGDVFVAHELSKVIKNANFHCIDTAFNYEIKNSIEQQIEKTSITLSSSLEELKAKNIIGNANIVLMLDVIEHVEDDVAFIKYLQSFSFINKDTFILITVPAFQSLYSEHDIFLNHFRRYNLTQLRITIQKSGLKSVNDGYFFISLLKLRIFQIMFQKIKFRKYKNYVSEYKSKGILTNFLVSLLYIDYLLGKFFRMIKFKLLGLSCFALCRLQ